MVHWVYVVECEDEYIYVGETTRLYRRMNEHQRGGGSVNTSEHEPLCLVGLYRVADNESFIEHHINVKAGMYDSDIIKHWGENDGDFLNVENHFTEQLMYLRSKKDTSEFMWNDGYWWKVRGGKYTKEMYEGERIPIHDLNKDLLMDRPCCDCQYPAEVKISKNKKCIYFVCAMKNAWGDFAPGLDYNEQCDFFHVYNDDTYLKKQTEISLEHLKESWCNNLPTGYDGGCIKCKEPHFSGVYTHGKRRQICMPCFGKHYESLKKQYDICMIDD